MRLKNQLGVGMVEVLVSLLILAVAVLGFVALQVRAIQASQDSVTKTQAMHFMQSISESIRTNYTAKADYASSLNTYLLASTKPSASKNCIQASCTPQEFAQFEAYQIAQQASAFGIEFGMAICPGISTSTPIEARRMCLFSTWNQTKLTGNADTLNVGNCMQDSGTYVAGSDCLMMETY